MNRLIELVFGVNPYKSEHARKVQAFNNWLDKTEQDRQAQSAWDQESPATKCPQLLKAARERDMKPSRFVLSNDTANRIVEPAPGLHYPPTGVFRVGSLTTLYGVSVRIDNSWAYGEIFLECETEPARDE